jgi:hypothetical protein
VIGETKVIKNLTKKLGFGNFINLISLESKRPLQFK